MSTLTPPELSHCVGHVTFTRGQTGRANATPPTNEYKTDPDLQAAHAAAPWLPVFDDHEVVDNWANETPGKPAPHFLDRRGAAMQAYYENMPLRKTAQPNGIHMQLYRRVQWGGLATFHMLDTRQYRDVQACGDKFRSNCPELRNPRRSITG